jgi:hypothetical protein
MGGLHTEISYCSDYTIKTWKNQAPTQQNFYFVALEADIALRFDFHAAFFPIKAARPGGRFLRHI